MAFKFSHRTASGIDAEAEARLTGATFTLVFRDDTPDAAPTYAVAPPILAEVTLCVWRSRAARMEGFEPIEARTFTLEVAPEDRGVLALSIKDGMARLTPAVFWGRIKPAWADAVMVDDATGEEVADPPVPA